MKKLLEAGAAIEKKDKVRGLKTPYIFLFLLSPFTVSVIHAHRHTHTYSSLTVECVFQLEATAVHWACRGGSLPALQLLLDQEAKFTSRDKVCPHTELGNWVSYRSPLLHRVLILSGASKSQYSMCLLL